LSNALISKKASFLCAICFKLRGHQWVVDRVVLQDAEQILSEWRVGCAKEKKENKKIRKKKEEKKKIAYPSSRRSW